MEYQNPLLTVDAIVLYPRHFPRIVLVSRVNEPLGWALPGGFVDYGETLESACVREVKEETGLDVMLTGLFGVYSNPYRDPRKHIITTVYMALPFDIHQLAAADDAKQVELVDIYNLPTQLCFDHSQIIQDFLQSLEKVNPPSHLSQRHQIPMV